MASDIDFDELDKAVNSLMGKVSDAPQKNDEDAPKQETLTISNTLKPGEKPEYDKIGEVAEKIANEALTTDGERIVLENLDNLQKPAFPDLSQPAHEVPAATPVVETTVAVVAPTAPLAATPAVAVTAAPKPPQPSSRPAIGRFMDVVHPSSDMRTPAKVPPVTSPAPLSPALPAVATSTIQPLEQPKESDQSLTSASADIPLTPFLPDAKVEKRPLGAIPSPFDAESSSAETPATISVAESNDQTTELPTQPQLDSTSNEPANLPAIENKEIEEPAAGVGLLQAIESGDTERIKSVSMGETSEQDGAIYDVNQYHQPLGKPAKQKSGIGTVVIIILIIVLAAALGGAAYFILGLGV